MYPTISIPDLKENHDACKLGLGLARKALRKHMNETGEIVDVEKVPMDLVLKNMNRLHALWAMRGLDKKYARSVKSMSENMLFSVVNYEVDLHVITHEKANMVYRAAKGLEIPMTAHHIKCTRALGDAEINMEKNPLIALKVPYRIYKTLSYECRWLGMEVSKRMDNQIANWLEAVKR